MGKFGKSRLRKGISIVAAMVLLLNTVLPTVPVFAEREPVELGDVECETLNTGKYYDTPQNFATYYFINDEESWQAAYDNPNSALRIYLDNNWDEDRWSESLGRNCDSRERNDPDNPTGFTVADCLPSWTGSINAPGAKYPWVAITLNERRNGILKFTYDGTDKYPYGNRVITLGYGTDSWYGVFSVIVDKSGETMFGDDYKINPDGTATTQMNPDEFSVSLDPGTDYIAVVEKDSNNCYSNLNWAIEDGGATDVILLKDATLQNSDYAGAESINVNLNGKTLTINDHAVGFANNEETVSLTFLNGGSNITLSQPSNPTKEGYTCSGWLAGDYTFGNPITGDITLEAVWDLDTYAITYVGAETGENATSYNYETDITLTAPEKEGYTFSGWTYRDVTVPVNPLTINAGEMTGDVTFTANWTAIEYEVTWNYKDSGGNDVTETGAVQYNQAPSHGNPATYEKDGKIYTFTGWTKEGVEGVVTLADEVITGDVTYTATYEETEKSKSSGSNGGSGGGGSSRTSASDDAKATTGDNAKDDSKTDDENKLDENGEENANEEENKDGEKVAPMTEAQAVEKFGQEQIDAYKWALENGITTMKTVEEARLDEPLTRAELAKMMVVYIQKVVQKDPVVTGDVTYPDVDESLGDLYGYIKLAYQYQIMGINADGTPIELFNPHGIVSRGEYATVFSRVLFGDKFNKSGEDFYTNHLEALKTAGILTNTLPSIQEMRGWVMLMMYRSSQNGEAIEKVANSTEEVVDEEKADETANEETVADETANEETVADEADTETNEETKTEETTSAESATGDAAVLPATEEVTETNAENTETAAESTTGNEASS